MELKHASRHTIVRGSLVSVVLAMLFSLLVTPAQAWGFANQKIADRANAYAAGSLQGQCKVFAQKVVNEVLAANGISARVGGYGSPGGAYYGAYRNAGGALIGANDAMPGDVIQTIRADQATSDNPSLVGLHTAIVVTRYGPGDYEVRDSNWHLDQRVSQHRWAPVSWAAAKRNNVGVYVWRFGTTSDAPRYAGHIVQWSGDTKAQKTAWYVTPDLRRLWIPDVATYNCLKGRGAPGPTVLPAATLNQLPDQTGLWAGCGDTLPVSRVLRRNMHLKSSDGRYTLWLQGDGNLVLYGPSGRALWANNRFNSDFLVMQSDGNLVTYTNAGTPTWATGTNGRGGNRFVVQSDGNLVIYSSTRAVWASNTAGRA